MEGEPLYKRQLGSKIYLLNSPVLTSIGLYSHDIITVSKAQQLVTYVGLDGKRYLKHNVVSAIGHKATALYLTKLLDVSNTIPTNRTNIVMETGDKALVLRCMVRLPVSKELTIAEMDKYAWQLTLLQRLSTY